MPAGNRPLRFVLLALVVLSLGSCGTSKDNDVAAGIVVQDSFFDPDPFAATVGDTITVVNLDGIVHTLTADDGSVDTGRIRSGGNRPIKVTRPGVIAYHCEIHNFMRGVIRVTA